MTKVQTETPSPSGGDPHDLTALVADPEKLRWGLEAADPGTLLMVLVQFTGDRELLERARPYIKGPANYQERMPEEMRAEIRARLATVLTEHAATGRPLPPLPEGGLLREMLSVAAGEPLSDEYVPMMIEDLAEHEVDPRGMAWRDKPPSERLEQFRVVIIGAGMSGLCAAIRLQEAGIRFTVLEKNDTVGGTWYENRYPGCGVDTPNHFYSYSFEPNHDWSEYFAKRQELWDYFERVADKYRLRETIRFGVEVEAARYEEATGTWRISTREADGSASELTANAVISSVGVLNRAKTPDIPGAADFEGSSFHTAEWPEDFDWRGKRIAMIGAGASAIQVAPAIAHEVERLTIFQRSPHWVVPNPNYHADVSDGIKWVLAHLPYYSRWYRFQLFWAFADGIHPALKKDPDWPDPETSLNADNERHRRFMVRHIKREIGDDPELLAKVIPDYPPYGKRILIDTHWFRALKRENVDLVTEPIARIVPQGVETADGKVREADAIVYATGFHAARMLWPMEVTGRGGKTTHDLWGDDDPRAYLGVTVPGFPNFFITTGPNTALAHGGNQIFQTECQVRHILRCLRELLEKGHRTIECRQQVHDDYNRKVDALHETMVWTHPGMRNWYRNEKGRVFAVSPWRLVEYWKLTGELQDGDYELA